jgi:hypothetical protein
MEASEVEPYILHRLRLVGWDGSPAFDQRVFRELYTATGGLPRRINMIVNRLLILGAVERRRRIDGVMLAQVLCELTADGALQLAPKAATSQAGVSQANAQPEPVSARAPAWNATVVGRGGMAESLRAGDPAGLPAGVSEALAQRDTQISELQQALIELANSVEGQGGVGQGGGMAALEDRVAQMEGRLIEQDRTIRHTLTMLIEWIERDESRRDAA